MASLRIYELAEGLRGLDPMMECTVALNGSVDGDVIALQKSHQRYSLELVADITPDDGGYIHDDDLVQVVLERFEPWHIFNSSTMMEWAEKYGYKCRKDTVNVPVALLDRLRGWMDRHPSGKPAGSPEERQAARDELYSICDELVSKGEID